VNALIWLTLLSLQIVDPIYPPDVITGGNVVAELRFVGGNVKALKILSGEEPFVGSTRSALSAWKMASKQDGDELVVVHFRYPFLDLIGNSNEQISPAKPGALLPYPKTVSPPLYPANAEGQGSVVLHVEISPEGRVTEVQVIKGLGALTETSSDAVRKWEFVAPVNAKGEKQASHAYAVFVYRFPISTGKEGGGGF
jgi:TonB family protein